MYFYPSLNNFAIFLHSTDVTKILTYYIVLITVEIIYIYMYNALIIKAITVNE